MKEVNLSSTFLVIKKLVSNEENLGHLSDQTKLK